MTATQPKISARDSSPAVTNFTTKNFRLESGAMLPEVTKIPEAEPEATIPAAQTVAASHLHQQSPSHAAHSRRPCTPSWLPCHTFSIAWFPHQPSTSAAEFVHLNKFHLSSTVHMWILWSARHLFFFEHGIVMFSASNLDPSRDQWGQVFWKKKKDFLAFTKGI